MNEHDQLGQVILGDLFKTMLIDEQWSIRERTGFTWWAHRLAQRVWVEPLLEFKDPPVIRVQAETALFCQVPNTDAVRARVDVMNKAASLNTYCFHPQNGRLTLRCCAYVTTETLQWLKHVLAAAIAIQVADAHIKGQADFARLFDAELDTSSHPSQGPREAMDDMLNVIENMFAPLGRGDSPFRESDFAELERLTPNPSTLTTPDKHGATAEFPFYERAPAILSWLFGARKGPGTALCQISSTERHPQLGSGAFWKLTLPVELSEAQVIGKAIELNLAEYNERPRPYFYGFGAWCSDPRLKTIAYVMFLPAAIQKPRILHPFFYSMAARARWTRQYLS